jgi:anti-sigma B factor antagonist
MHTQDSPVGSDRQAVFPSPLFAIAAAEEGGAYVIWVEGELDLCECPRLECALRKAEVSPANRILLDLEKLTFIDAAGLSVLVTAWRRSVNSGGRLRVSRGRDNVAYMLHLTALDTVLPFIRA